MFSTGMKNKWPSRHYVDLFAGAGFVRVRDDGAVIAGSTVIAANVADPFSRIHACERDARNADALKRRLSIGTLPAEPNVHVGDANELIDDILKAVPGRGSLSIVFADPYGLHLDFNTVERISEKRADLIVLLADNMDALRNWAAYYVDNENSNLDRFMGERGWRELLPALTTNRQAEALRDRYLDRLRSVGFEHFGTERVRNARGRDIYSLVYASRHKTGLKFWNEARKVDEGGQRSLGW